MPKPDGRSKFPPLPAEDSNLEQTG